MMRHSQPQPQPQTTYCATLSSCQLQGWQKEGFIKIKREEKRDGKKANREKERERVEHVQGTGIPNLYMIITKIWNDIYIW